jgi:hypothetical protein
VKRPFSVQQIRKPASAARPASRIRLWPVQHGAAHRTMTTDLLAGIPASMRKRRLATRRIRKERAL